MFNIFKRKQKPQKLLIVLGTDFGSYQLNQLVDVSDEYQVAGFISDDPWQRKSSFGKVGVFYSSEIKGLCEKQEIAAIVLPSDQKEIWLKPESPNNAIDGGESEQGVEARDEIESPLSGLEVKHCDILTIQSDASKEEANRFLSELVGSG